MTIGQIRFSQPYIPQKQNYPLNANKSVSFGTKLVNPNNLRFVDHAKARMIERNISTERLKAAIQSGVAYDAGKSGRICIIDRQNSMTIIMERDKKTVVTAIPVAKHYEQLENGCLVKSKDTILTPLQEPTKLIKTANGGYKEVLPDGTVIKERIVAENGYIEKGRDGKIEKEHIVTENGYIEKGRDGKIEKVLVKDKTAISKCDVDYYYLPLEDIIKHRGNEYTKDMPEYNTFKQKFFSAYA